MTCLEYDSPPSDRLSPEDQPVDPEGRLAKDDEQGRKRDLAQGVCGGAESLVDLG